MRRHFVAFHGCFVTVCELFRCVIIHAAGYICSFGRSLWALLLAWMAAEIDIPPTTGALSEFLSPPSQIKTPLTFWFQSLYENTLVVFKTTSTCDHVTRLSPPRVSRLFTTILAARFFCVCVPKRWDVFNKILLLASQHLAERDTGKRRRSALCLQAKGVMFNFWNEAIENQLTLQRGALKFRGVKLAFVLFSLVWIFFRAAFSKQGEKNELPPTTTTTPSLLPYFEFYPKKEWQRLYLFQMTEFKWTRSATENVFSLKCLGQNGRNKHAPHAPLLLFRSLLVRKWSLFRGIRHRCDFSYSRRILYARIWCI